MSRERAIPLPINHTFIYKCSLIMTLFSVWFPSYKYGLMFLQFMYKDTVVMVKVVCLLYDGPVYYVLTH